MWAEPQDGALPLAISGRYANGWWGTLIMLLALSWSVVYLTLYVSPRLLSAV